MPGLTIEDDVHILNLGDDENRFTPDWITESGAALDEVARANGPRALITVATGKFWSNGLDLDWLGANPDKLESYVASVHGLFRECSDFRFHRSRSCRVIPSPRGRCSLWRTTVGS